MIRSIRAQRTRLLVLLNMRQVNLLQKIYNEVRRYRRRSRSGGNYNFRRLLLRFALRHRRERSEPDRTPLALDLSIEPDYVLAIPEPPRSVVFRYPSALHHFR